MKQQQYLGTLFFIEITVRHQEQKGVVRAKRIKFSTRGKKGKGLGREASGREKRRGAMALLEGAWGGQWRNGVSGEEGVRESCKGLGSPFGL